MGDTTCTVDGVTFTLVSAKVFKASVAGTWYAATTYNTTSATIVTHAAANTNATITTGTNPGAICFIPD